MNLFLQIIPILIFSTLLCSCNLTSKNQTSNKAEIPEEESSPKEAPTPNSTPTELSLTISANFQGLDARGSFYNTNENMNVLRTHHSASILNNNHVLIMGGYYSSALFGQSTYQSTEVYNPDTQTFRMGPNMNDARKNFKSINLSDGRVLVVGNDTNSNYTAEIYTQINQNGDGYFTPITGNGCALDRMLTQHTLTLLSDGNVLITGGYIVGGIATNKASIFDRTTNCFSNINNMTDIMYNHSATMLDNDEILLVGSAEYGILFNQSSKTFRRTINKLNTSRICHFESKFNDGRVIIGGGQNNALEVIKTIEIYDPFTESFALENVQLNHARCNAKANLVSNQYVLITGGVDFTTLNTGFENVEFFDTNTSTITEKSTGDHLFYQTTTVLQDGSLLLTGGTSNGVPYAKIFDLYLGATSTIQASGGVAPYNYMIEEGNANVDLNSGKLWIGNSCNSSITASVTDSAMNLKILNIPCNFIN